MRRVTRTSCQSTPSSCPHSVKFSETSAKPSGLRESAPLKMTSAISPPRKRFGGLFAEDPADGVEHVGFPAAVGADDGGHAFVKIKDCFIGERLKAEELERLKMH